MEETNRYFLYDEIRLYIKGGMLTEQSIPPIRNGRAIQFIFEDGITAGREIFTCFDGVVSGPIKNGSGLETPIASWERLLPCPHETKVLVVSRCPFPVDDLVVPVSPFTIQFADSRMGNIHVDARLRADIQCREPSQMVAAYEQGEFTSPETKGICELRRAAYELLPTLKDQLSACDPMHAVERVNGTLAATMASRIACLAEKRVPWMAVRNPELVLTVTNVDAIAQQSNSIIELSVQMQKKMAETCLEMYAQSDLPPQIATILKEFINANPGISETKVMELSERLKRLSQRHDPQQILEMVRNMQLIPPPNP